jgi:2-polyprenyl-3-methyl-5-hydroxy-6-metoxy-1,4-benzoquinol methylase
METILRRPVIRRTGRAILVGLSKTLAYVERLLVQSVLATRRLQARIAPRGSGLQPANESPPSPERLITEHVNERDIDAILRSLGKQLVDGHTPNFSYLGTRFGDYEMSVLSIKALGYELARALADQRMSRSVEAPPATSLPSKLCTQSDMESEWCLFWAREMRAAPIYHRKLWEFCYVAQVLWRDNKMKPGMTGVGFGCGQEPLPSLFAKYGASVLATDLDPTRSEADGWKASGQHAAAIDAVRRRDVCPDEALLANIDFRSVDMNAVPPDLDGKFDFCWSSCSLEHLGSIENGLRFIERSLQTLKPGGIAVHTTEYNLSDGDTIDEWPTVLFQRKHIVPLVLKLRRNGYEVAELDLSPGDGFLDGFIDIPPWTHNVVPVARQSHLKISIQGFPCTSVGLIVKRM